MRSRDDPQLARLLEIAVLCNDASLERTEEDGSGDPMEIALLRAGLIAGLERSALLKQSPIVRKEAFDTASQDDGDGAPARRRVSVRGQRRAGSGAGCC